MRTQGRCLGVLAVTLLASGCVARPRLLPAGPFTREQPELPPGGPTPAPELYTVSQVYDGDTLQVLMQGRRVQVRLQGVNSPEKPNPYRAEECFGPQSTAFAHAVLDGRAVMLASDPTQDDEDRFGRKLRYVWTDDGRFFNLALLREGYAYEYTYDQPYQYQAAFKTEEATARDGNKGLWSPQTCAGQRSAPPASIP